MTAIRLSAIGLSLACSVAALFVFAAPVARAQSDGVPMISGAWSGKITTVYWDQTTGGAVHPKQKFKSKCTATIDQKGGAIAITLTLDQNMPVNTSSASSIFMLNGDVGNYHLNGVLEAGINIPAMTLSGTSNKKGTSLTLKGVAASDELTHDVTIKLKRIGP